MASWAIIENRGLLLFVQRSTKTSRAGQWCLPGGSIKNEETAIDACIREVKEETDLDVLVINKVASPKNEHYFRCQLTSSRIDVSLKKNECQSHQWIIPENLLDLGMIMNLKELYPLLTEIGYVIKLTEEAKQYLS